MTTLTIDEYEEAREFHQGFCRVCLELSGECVEPDAEDYECDLCGAERVTGIENALVEGLIEVS